MTQVTKDMRLSEILKADIGIAQILMRKGMHCLGCPSAQAETLGQAGMAHGIEAEALVNEINEYLAAKK